MYEKILENTMYKQVEKNTILARRFPGFCSRYYIIY